MCATPFLVNLRQSNDYKGWALCEQLITEAQLQNYNLGNHLNFCYARSFANVSEALLRNVQFKKWELFHKSLSK